MTEKNNNNNESTHTQSVQHTLHYAGLPAATDSGVLQLAAHLQSTLELGEMLALYHEQSAALVPHAGLSYVNQDEGCEIELGEAAAHRCSYQLLLPERHVGELAFWRQTAFTDSERQQLETLTATLIYPLRNALLYKQAVEKAQRDSLTGVGNRGAMDYALEQEIELAVRHGTSFSALMIDIDKFKQINDSYGHIVGDIALRRVADNMLECVRRSDVVYRYGGEEFVILLRNTQELGASLLAERIRRSVEVMRFKHDEQTIKVTVSVGLSSMRQGDTPSMLLDRCDHALYEAKEEGRNRIAIADA